ncbi:hypothetical protein BD311DRAFT_487943 [Dichomitus squalens]|uniref:Uncharacterized protein n=1 Tax=Dichomitus squalens TaxID=114155 RepID=A0A4V6MVV2_9APHY|nr:hypothetical protein BD311DRAFT_487943 [Dichomitus squalens]
MRIEWCPPVIPRLMSALHCGIPSSALDWPAELPRLGTDPAHDADARTAVVEMSELPCPRSISRIWQVQRLRMIDCLLAHVYNYKLAANRQNMEAPKYALSYLTLCATLPFRHVHASMGLITTTIWSPSYKLPLHGLRNIRPFRSLINFRYGLGTYLHLSVLINIATGERRAQNDINTAAPHSTRSATFSHRSMAHSHLSDGVLAPKLDCYR